MRFNKKILLTMILAVLVIALIAPLIFPGAIRNIITGFASLANFGVAVNVTNAHFETENLTQLSDPIVDQSAPIIQMPITYYGDIIMNISLPKPEGYECISNWYVNESGVIKNVSVNGTILRWEANKSTGIAYMYFEAPIPVTISEVTYSTDSYYEKTLTIDSCCRLQNVRVVNVSVSQNHTGYGLYLVENNTLVDKTEELHFTVIGGIATFYGFNLSTKTFRIKTPQPETVVTAIGTDGGNHITHFETSQRFSVEPTSIVIRTSVGNIFTEAITIDNLRSSPLELAISSTNDFIRGIPSSISVPGKDSAKITFTIDTSALSPGEYADHISISDGQDEEKVSVRVEKFQGAGATDEGIKSPAEEKPAQLAETLSQKAGQKPAEPLKLSLFNLLIAFLGIILLIVLGMLLYSLIQGKPQAKELQQAQQSIPMQGQDVADVGLAALGKPSPGIEHTSSIADNGTSKELEQHYLPGRIGKKLWPEEYFYLNDGRVIKSLAELVTALKVMSNETFSHHVTSQKNDFANWLANTLGKEELAGQLLALRTKEDMLLALEAELKKAS